MKPKLAPRNAHPLGIATEAWWYEGKTDIDVFVRGEFQRNALSARIEKRQIIGWLRRLGYTVEKPR